MYHIGQFRVGYEHCDNPNIFLLNSLDTCTKNKKDIRFEGRNLKRAGCLRLDYPLYGEFCSPYKDVGKCSKLI